MSTVLSVKNRRLGGSQGIEPGVSIANATSQILLDGWIDLWVLRLGLREVI